MVVYFDIENLLDGLLDGLYSWVAKFDYFACIRHDDVVVLLVEIGFLVMRLILPKLVFAHQGTVQKQFDGVVQRRTTHAVILVFHLDVEVFYIKMLFAVVNFLKDCVTLRRFAVAFVFQVFRKNVTDDFLVFAVIYGYECHKAKIMDN